MTLPLWRDWLFSAKAFTAAMLALYIALACDLPRPYWAMTTVYVVANPLSGTTNSKALYRTLGTLLGATAAVVLVPLFVNAPELLTLAVALWAGCLCYAAALDRTPRGYVFMLSAYTLPLIALPSLSTPDTIFDVAVARSEEIILGIVCASVIGAIVFPVSIGPIFNARIASWLRDAATWADDILHDRAGPATPIARQRLAADVTALDMFIGQISHSADTRGRLRWARELRGRLLLLLPMLSSLADRLHALKLEAKELPPELASALNEIADWIAGRTVAGSTTPDRLRSSLAALQPSREELGRWEGLLTTSLLSRLNDVVDLWQDCLVLQRLIASGQEGEAWRPAFSRNQLVPGTRYYDHGLILFACGSAVLATLAAGLIWIQSGWPGGAFFVAMTTVACCFFGLLDRPAAAMRTMVVWLAVSTTGAALYLFAVLPRIHDFEMVVLTLAVPFLLIGAFIPRPQLMLITLVLATNSTGSLAFQSRYSMDFAAYANEGLAALGGVLFALTWTLVTKPFGAEIAARRLLRAGWSDLATLAEGKRKHDLSALAGRNLDRLSQLVPRWSVASPDQETSVDILREIRIGYNIVALQRDRRLVAGRARDSIDTVLSGVATFARQSLSAGNFAADGPRDLRDSIDTTFRTVREHGEGSAELDTLQSLVGLRRALFPHEAGPPPEPRPLDRQQAPFTLMAAE